MCTVVSLVDSAGRPTLGIADRCPYARNGNAEPNHYGEISFFSLFDDGPCDAARGACSSDRMFVALLCACFVDPFIVHCFVIV